MKQDSQKTMDNQTATVAVDSRRQPNQKVGWKYVVLGQSVGVLLGAGAAFFLKHRASENAASDSLEDEGASPEGWIAADDSQSFEQAIEEAREAVGSMGAVSWRGGVYATSSQEEWMAMDDTERQAIVEQFEPEVPADVIDVKPVVDVGTDGEPPEVEPFVDEVSVEEQNLVETQTETFALENDGYIHVNDSEGNDFVFADGEQIDVSDSADVMLVEADVDADQDPSMVVEDVDDVSVVLDDAAIVVDDDAVSVVFDDAMADSGGMDEFGAGDAFPEPMAFTLPEDDMVGTLTEGFGDDGFVPFDVQPLENCFLDSDPVAQGADSQ